jgi:hypothetical protein
VGVEIGGEPEARLDVEVCGYIFTANWRYESAGDDSDDDVSAWISSIISTDCSDYLLPGAILSNTLQVRKETSLSMRAWDVLEELVELGDVNGNPWRLWVDNSRYVNYKQIPTAPQYYIRGGELYTSAAATGSLDPLSVRPAVVRVMDYPVRKTELGSWLDDARDFYISEVSWGTGAGLVLKTEYWDESEILTAQAEYAGRLSGGGSGGGASRLNWKRQMGWEPGSPEWEAAAGASWKERQDILGKARKKRKKRG